MRLFVDCDDTLVIFEEEGAHPYALAGGYKEPHHFNVPLIAFIRRFRQRNPDDLIVIWSGGGRRYAQTVAEAAGLGDIGAGYLIKDASTFDLVRAKDIVVDDQQLDFGRGTNRPYQVNPHVFDPDGQWDVETLDDLPSFFRAVNPDGDAVVE